MSDNLKSYIVELNQVIFYILKTVGDFKHVNLIEFNRLVGCIKLANNTQYTFHPAIHDLIKCCSLKHETREHYDDLLNLTRKLVDFIKVP